MRLKSILLLPVIISLSFIAIFSVIHLVGSSGSLAWFGVLMASAPLPGFVTFLMIKGGVARTSSNLPAVLGLGSVGVVITLISISNSGITPFALAASGFMAHLWYVFSYSRYGRKNSKTLELGKALPDFHLLDEHGNRVNAQEFRNQPSLLLFYRGNWCPLCMAQIREVADAYKDLSAMGVQVAMISPQPHEDTIQLAAKFDVPFRFLTDANSSAALALDIFAKGGTPMGLDIKYGSDTVLPTVIATNQDGIVIFLDQTDNYRVRPEPETFIEIFKNNLPSPISEETHSQTEPKTPNLHLVGA